MIKYDTVRTKSTFSYYSDINILILDTSLSSLVTLLLINLFLSYINKHTVTIMQQL